LLSLAQQKARYSRSDMHPNNGTSNLELKAASDLNDLIEILQLAYSGELAAAYAYRGHWHSVRDPETRARIRKIEEEEWHHRRLVGRMLDDVGSKPNRIRELRAFIIGRVLGLLCHLAGWLLPMYGAGKLESRNIREYELAARYAARSGYPEFADSLLTMAEVEWEHESYFRRCVENHRWSARIRLWTAPPRKETIRASFNSDAL
jgi:rubrerythrin